MNIDSVSAVQARIASIQQRFASPGPAAAGGSSTEVLSQTLTRANAASAGTSTGSVRAATATPVSGTTAAPAGWARRLPAAGQEWADEITAAADKHGLDPRLLASLVWTESNFDPDAVSHAGARGLSQLMPGTAAGLGVDPNDPVQNLDGGARFLKSQLDRFGSVDLALAAYNAGPGRVAQAGGIPNIAETQAYVPKVLAHLEELSG